MSPASAMLDHTRLDRIYQYILATARQLDDFAQRELGPIHLLKYAYLADLAHASSRGETFTGADWSFFHFGPWSAAAHERIEPALLAASATKKTVKSRFADDFIRYAFDDKGDAETLSRELENDLPLSVVGAITVAIRQHGSDTSDLLRHVYLTPPMLRAKPGESLVFEGPTPVEREAKPESMLDRKARKDRDAAIAAARSEVVRRLATRKPPSNPIPAPRYDEVFYEGTAHLDKMAGESIAAGTGVVEFEDSIWASEQRREPEIS